MAPTELYKYNPDRCSAEERAKTFVARQPIVDGILDELRSRVQAPANQHYLITGARGNGKTTLLLMVRDRIQAEEGLKQAYQPIRFNEEEYSITSLRDLFHRTAELILESSPDDALQKAYDEIDKARDEEEGTERAIAAVREYSRRSGRKLVLLIDNLDLILGQQVTDKAEQGRLRDLLMNESFLVLVAAAPKHFEEVSGYDKPFYEFFRHVDLDELTSEQMDELIRKRAEWDGNAGMIENFDKLAPRLRALEHLTGGNPRLALMLYQVFAHNELAEVQTALTRLLDDITPYYRDRLNDLSAQQRKVIDVFAKRGRPTTPTELAEELRLPVNQVNSILQRLKQAGFVALAKQERRKATLYIVSERMFRIWHQMRFSPAGRKRLEFLVEFLRLWYSPREWQSELDRLLGEYRQAAKKRAPGEAKRFIEYLDYLADAAPETQLKEKAIERTLRSCIDAGDSTQAESILRERMQEAEREEDKTMLSMCWFRMAHLYFVKADYAEEIAALRKSVQWNPANARALVNLGGALAIKALSRSQAERESMLQEARANCEASIRIDPGSKYALRVLAVALIQLAALADAERREGLLREACEKYKTAATIGRDDHITLQGWGDALVSLANLKADAERESLLRDACAKYGNGAQIEPNNDTLLWRWGQALGWLAELNTGVERGRLQREACERFSEASRVAPDAPEPLNAWGIALGLLASGASADEAALLLTEASAKLEQAVKLANLRKNREVSAIYTSNLVRCLLDHCRVSIKSNNTGQARGLFCRALDRWAGAGKRWTNGHLVLFFEHIARPESSGICAELVKMMMERKMEDELALVGPFVMATYYWQSGKKAEILDQLNPEVREVVEEIIRRGEEPGQDEKGPGKGGKKRNGKSGDSR